MNLFSNYYLYFKNHGFKYVIFRASKSLEYKVRKFLARVQGKNEISTIYNGEYYEDISNLPNMNRFIDELYNYFQPKTLLDVGCGNGPYLREFLKRGVDAQGVDGSDWAKQNALVDPKYIQVFDLRKKLELGKKFDLVICIEVAEHLQAKFASTLVGNMTRHADKLFFTAAIPGQGGDDHINEQPNEYWIKLFEEQGFEYKKEDTMKMRESLKEKKVAWWLSQNAMIFIKNK
ncbi:MAG: class I SAM-dependent methyltransferase [Candidatus Dojkabacteria bacterium]